MKYKNKIYFYIAIFLLLTLVYFNFNFSTFKEGLNVPVGGKPWWVKWPGLEFVSAVEISRDTNGLSEEGCLKKCEDLPNCNYARFDQNGTCYQYSSANNVRPATYNTTYYIERSQYSPPPAAPTCPPPPPPPLPPLPGDPYPTSDSMAADAAAYKAARATGLNEADSRKAGASAGLNYLKSKHDDKYGDARIAGIAYAYAKKLGKTDAEANVYATEAINAMWNQQPGGFIGLNLYVNNYIEMAALTPFANSTIGTLPPRNSAIIATDYTLELNTARNSNDTRYDIKSLTYTTPDECVIGCNSEPTCKGFVFDTRSYANSCILKSNWDGPGYAKDGINSYKNVQRTQPPPPTEPPPPTCSDILKESMKKDLDKRKADGEAFDETQQYIYEQAKILSDPSISQVNSDTGIINKIKADYDALLQKKINDKKKADADTIFKLQKDAEDAAKAAAAKNAKLASQIPSYKANKEFTQKELEEIERNTKIKKAVDKQAKEDIAEYNLLKNGIGTQISKNIGDYTPQYTLEQTIRDICDNVISNIGNTTKVLTDKMGNFVGPDGLLSKFNGFTNDNSLYNSIDKIDSVVSKKDNMLNEIYYTLTNYNENKNKLDASNNPIPYEADTILNIARNRYCVSDYDDKLGDPLCCGRTGVVSKYNRIDQCGPSAKWCVKVENKQHGFCSPNKPTN